MVVDLRCASLDPLCVGFLAEISLDDGVADRFRSVDHVSRSDKFNSRDGDGEACVFEGRKGDGLSGLKAVIESGLWAGDDIDRGNDGSIDRGLEFCVLVEVDDVLEPRMCDATLEKARWPGKRGENLESLGDAVPVLKVSTLDEGACSPSPSAFSLKACSSIVVLSADEVDPFDIADGTNLESRLRSRPLLLRSGVSFSGDNDRLRRCDLELSAPCIVGLLGRPDVLLASFRVRSMFVLFECTFSV